MGFQFYSPSAAKIYSLIPKIRSPAATNIALADFALNSTECISGSFDALNNMLLNEQGAEKLQAEYARAVQKFLGVLDAYLAGRDDPGWRPTTQRVLDLVAPARGVLGVTSRALDVRAVNWNDWNADMPLFDAVWDVQAFCVGYLEATALELEQDARGQLHDPAAALTLLAEIAYPPPAPADALAKFFAENYIATAPSPEVRKLLAESGRSGPRLATGRAVPSLPDGTGAWDPATLDRDPLRDPLEGGPDGQERRDLDGRR